MFHDQILFFDSEILISLYENIPIIEKIEITEKEQNIIFGEDKIYFSKEIYYEIINIYNGNLNIMIENILLFLIKYKYKEIYKKCILCIHGAIKGGNVNIINWKKIPAKIKEDITNHAEEENFKKVLKHLIKFYENPKKIVFGEDDCDILANHFTFSLELFKFAVEELKLCIEKDTIIQYACENNSIECVDYFLKIKYPCDDYKCYTNAIKNTNINIFEHLYRYNFQISEDIKIIILCYGTIENIMFLHNNKLITSNICQNINDFISTKSYRDSKVNNGVSSYSYYNYFDETGYATSDDIFLEKIIFLSDNYNIILDEVITFISYHGFIKSFEYLLSKNCNYNKYHVMNTAGCNGQIDFLKYLFKMDNQFCRNCDLSNIIYFGKYECYKFLLDHGNIVNKLELQKILDIGDNYFDNYKNIHSFSHQDEYTKCYIDLIRNNLLDDYTRIVLFAIETKNMDLINLNINYDYKKIMIFAIGYKDIAILKHITNMIYNKLEKNAFEKLLKYSIFSNLDLLYQHNDNDNDNHNYSHEYIHDEKYRTGYAYGDYGHRINSQACCYFIHKHNRNNANYLKSYIKYLFYQRYITKDDIDIEWVYITIHLADFHFLMYMMKLFNKTSKELKLESKEKIQKIFSDIIDTDLSIKIDTFDIIYCNSASMHFIDQDDFLRQC
jgi:hypothetical protein